MAVRWLSGVAVVAWGIAGLMPWWSSGVASALTPIEIAGVILDGRLPVPRALGLVPLTPFLGVAAALLALGWPDWRGPWLAQVVFGALSGAVVIAMPGRGPVSVGGMALLAATVLALGAIISMMRAPGGARPAGQARQTPRSAHARSDTSA